jgi:hypothetical protein
MLWVTGLIVDILLSENLSLTCDSRVIGGLVFGVVQTVIMRFQAGPIAKLISRLGPRQGQFPTLVKACF